VQSFIETVLGEADLLLMPVSLPSAPPFSPQDELEARDIDFAFSQMATMTRFANYLGLPAISIPSGCDSNGLPTAIQLVGRPFEESLLLSTAAHFESLLGTLTYPGQDSVSTKQAV
jgi:aspartyl-tRNA(Asn)/glutamyl-tRNA(Gln) amidotransferase subunit A